MIKTGAYTSYGYKSAEELRGSGRALPAGGSADRHLRNDRELLGNEADEHDRNSAIYEAILNRTAEAVLGRDGFTFRALTPDPELNARMEADMRAWQKRPEITGEFDWQECEELTLRAIYNWGDIGVMRTNAERVQYFEAARITGGRRQVTASRASGGRVEQGVELDALGRRLAYWVAPYDRHGNLRKANAKRIKAEDFILPAYRKKFSQTRGVAIAATAFPLIHRLTDVLDSEAIAWQQLARFVLAFEMEGGPQKGFAKSEADDDGRDSPPDLADRVVDIEQGTIVFGERGDKVKPIPREIPGANFPESVRTFLRIVGMPFGLPLSFLLLDYSDTTYTSSRAELEQAFRVFIKRQRMLKRRHHNPITEWWIRWGVEAGRYPMPPAGTSFWEFYRFEWKAPEFPWIDQLKEAQAWGMRIDRGLATQEEALQSTGSSLEAFHTQRELEITKAREIAARVSGIKVSDLPPVDWRYFGGYAVSKTESIDEDRLAAEKKDPAPGKEAGK